MLPKECDYLYGYVNLAELIGIDIKVGVFPGVTQPPVLLKIFIDRPI